ncbi:hypothetical protein K440DRAFT_546898 [Wilcoxina mikolae CBS 423.85]|nr:hypothetical protein K440DRAFT_546898 [Wilcoxina mikolae CBS 423.85]
MADTFQESLPDGLTVIPVILSRDKIILSTLSGDKSVWPVYLSIGNLFKVKWRSVKSNGLILIGLLLRFPNSPKTHTITIGYPESMAIIRHPLEEPVKSGFKVLCAVSHTHHVYSPSALFLTDYPEQCIITGVKYGWYSGCKIDPDDMPRFICRSR